MENSEELKSNTVNPNKLVLPIQESIKKAIALGVRNTKKVILISGLAGIGLFVNSCVAGFVPMEPTYVEFARPPRPGNLYIWIDGDWRWNNQSHIYVQQTGYWKKPYQGQTYVPGNWQTGPKGKYWSNGRWQKQSHQNSRRK